MATTDSQIKFRLAIVGGGIAGLVLAVALQHLSSGDIRVDIYESAKEFTEFGAGVSVLRRPWKVLKNLGLAEDLARLTDKPDDEDAPRGVFDIRKSDQAHGIAFYKVVMTMGLMAFHRAEFQQALASKLDPSIVTSHFSKRLLSYTEDESTNTVRLHFKDGATATCDAYIGADGIHSATRRCLLKDEADAIELSDSERAKLLLSKMDPMWSGTITYRAVIPRDRLRKINPEHSALRMSQTYVGKFKHVIAIPITLGSDELVNLAFARTWPERDGSTASDVIHACDKEEVRSEFIGWEEEVQQLIQCIESPTKWAVNELRGLPICTRGRVALIGDAAHAMTPFQGSGAGQALEDAYILANLLAHPKTTLATLPDALKVYEAIRLPHANRVQQKSRVSGRLYELLNCPWEESTDRSSDDESELSREMTTDPKDMEMLKQIGDDLVKNWEWAWTTDIDDDLERAVKMLKERIG